MAFFFVERPLSDSRSAVEQSHPFPRRGKREDVDFPHPVSSLSFPRHSSQVGGMEEGERKFESLSRAVGVISRCHLHHYNPIRAVHFLSPLARRCDRDCSTGGLSPPLIYVVCVWKAKTFVRMAALAGRLGTWDARAYFKNYAGAGDLLPTGLLSITEWKGPPRSLLRPLRYELMSTPCVRAGVLKSQRGEG